MAKPRVVCTFCKKRKIKCDRQTPCSSCVRFGNVHCNYGTKLPKSNNLRLVQQLARRVEFLDRRLNDASYRDGEGSPDESQGQDNGGQALSLGSRASPPTYDGGLIWPNPDNSPESGSDSDDDDAINIQEQYDAMAAGQHHGPFLWLGLIKLDPELNYINSHLTKDPNLQVLYAAKMSKPVSFNIFHNRTNQAVADPDLLKAIDTALPPNKDVWKLVDYFYERIYCFLPLLDERDFRVEVLSTVGDADEARTMKYIGWKTFMFLGQLILVLRLSSLASDGLPFIGTDVLELGLHCIRKYDLIKTHSIEFLQLLAVYKYMEFNAPEIGCSLDNNSSNISMTIILQKAVLLKLHRDPLKMHPNREDGRHNNLRRKLWFFLLIFDALESTSSGNPASFLKFSFDTKIPYHTPENSNTLETGIEDMSVTLLQNCKGFLTGMTTFSSAWCSLHKPISSRLLKKSTENQYNFFMDNHEIYQSLVHHEYDREHYNFKSIKLKFSFQNFCFLISTYIYIFEHYSKKNSPKTDGILVDLFKIVFHRLLPILNELICELFGKPIEPYKEPASKLVLSVTIQTLVTKCINVILMVLTKTKANTGLNFALQKALDLFLNFQLKLANTCYYSWRMNKIFHQFSAFIKQRQFYNGKIDSALLEVLVDQALNDLDFNATIKSMGSPDVDDTIWLHVLGLNRIRS